jgi:type II secretory pathway pseudopilin PulG
MFERLRRDESGVALGLTIILIVLIGVMGAGLLTFVRSDLDAVVEVNQGQRALSLADADVQAARRQLRSDAVPDHYDGDAAQNVEWARVPPAGATRGKTLTLEDGAVRVEIRYLLPSTTAAEVEDADHAPEPVPGDLTDYPGGEHYFEVISEGTAGGALRKIEAILYTSRLDAPATYYTPNDIALEGDIGVSGLSLFAGGNINRVRSVNIDRAPAATYGDWDTTSMQPPSRLNTVPRTDAAGNRTLGAGLAAEGLVCQDGDCSDSPANSVADGIHDYDRYTGAKGSNKQFVRKPDPDQPNAPATISYPFDPEIGLDLDFLMEEAERQGNYRSSAVDITDADYPASSSDRTVFFVDAGGDTESLEYAVDRTPQARGTMVVRDGNLTISDSSSGFSGVIIVTGNGTDTGRYVGNADVEGFVVASGDMTIRGSVSPSTVSLTTRPGFYDVRLWGWRELYE